MTIRYSRVFSIKMEKLKKRDVLIEKKINRQLLLLASNPRHPSLRLHKISGKYEAWSIGVDMRLRILFVYREYGILMADIGSHDEVY